MFNLFMGGLTMGTSILAAQYYGKGDTTSIEKIFAYVTKISFLIATGFFLVSLFIPGSLMRFFTTEPQLISGGCIYLRIVSSSYLLSLIHISIKDCAREKGLVHCHACAEYPCRRINALEKSYQKRYRASLTANSRFVQEEGLAAFMARQRERYTCPVCGDIISLHDAACSECGAAQPSASFSFP